MKMNIKWLKLSGEKLKKLKLDWSEREWRFACVAMFLAQKSWFRKIRFLVWDPNFCPRGVCNPWRWACLGNTLKSLSPSYCQLWGHSMPVREGFNNPSHGNCPRGVPPPPPGAITDDIFPKSYRKKVNGKGGYPPPLHERSVTKNRNFFAENGVFCLKNTVFGPIFNGFFLNGNGGYSPPPSRTAGSKNPNGKKLTERGGTPPLIADEFFSKN